MYHFSDIFLLKDGMIVNKVITVYHWSNHILEVPTFGLGRKNNYFGLGFYCTESNDLAKEWAVSLKNRVNASGTVNRFF